jgi:glycosyltransferase involved in cell wall biosynthesis
MVDESLFNPHSTHSSLRRQQFLKQLGVTTERKVAVWPARLTQAKGIVQFLERIDAKLLQNWTVLIVGEGPLKVEISNSVKMMNLDDRVLIKDYIDYEKMPQLYRSADLFILASLYDRNPLSVVEAMSCGLPLLLSNRLGNFSEALSQGVNGWGFDPYDVASVEKAVELAFTATTHELVEMGQRSSRRAKKYWNTERSVRAFLDIVLK